MLGCRLQHAVAAQLMWPPNGMTRVWHDGHCRDFVTESSLGAPSCWCLVALIRRQVSLSHLFPTASPPASILIHDITAAACLSQHPHAQKRPAFPKLHQTLPGPSDTSSPPPLEVSFCSVGFISFQLKLHTDILIYYHFLSLRLFRTHS